MYFCVDFCVCFGYSMGRYNERGTMDKHEFTIATALTILLLGMAAAGTIVVVAIAVVWALR